MEKFGRRRRKTPTTGSRASALRTTSAVTAPMSSAPAGASTTTSATPTRTSCSPGLSAQGGSGIVFTADRHRRASARIPTARFCKIGLFQSRTSRRRTRSIPQGPFYSSQLAPPQIRQPWTSQTSVGWSHQLATITVFDVDFVDSRGHDLGVRWPLNTPDINRRRPPLRRPQPEPRQSRTLNMSVGEQRVPGSEFRAAAPHGPRDPVQRAGTRCGSKGISLGGRSLDELTEQPGPGCDAIRSLTSSWVRRGAPTRATG